MAPLRPTKNTCSSPMASPMTSRSSTSRRKRLSNPFRLANCPGVLPSGRTEKWLRLCRTVLARAKSNLSFLAAGIIAGPFRGGPLGVIADPLGDVGLRSHHALIEGAIPSELKIFFFAIGGGGDGADCQGYFDHSS